MSNTIVIDKVNESLDIIDLLLNDLPRKYQFLNKQNLKDAVSYCRELVNE